MPRAVKRRKLISFVAHFGPPSLVWLVGAYLLYRATQLDGSASERAFALGLLLTLCASRIFAVRRSRQTETRERALETQLQTLTQRFRDLERRFDKLLLDLQTDVSAQVLSEAVNRHNSEKPPWMRLISTRDTKDTKDTPRR